MNKLFALIMITAVAGTVVAENTNIVRQYVAYLEANDQHADPLPFRMVCEGGSQRLEYWGAAVPVPSDAQLTAPAVLDLPKKYRKRDGVKWIEKTSAEKDLADTDEITATVTNDVTLMSLIEVANEGKGQGAKDITVSNLVVKIKGKKK